METIIQHTGAAWSQGQSPCVRKMDVAQAERRPLSVTDSTIAATGMWFVALCKC